MSPFKDLYRIWFTGFLYCLAALGYVFYFLLLSFRMIQRKALLLIPVLVLIAFGAGLFYILGPVGPTGNNVVVIVEPGTSVRSIASGLESEKVVRFRKAFELWVRFRGLDRKMQAGRYVFTRGEGVLRAADKLRHVTAIDIAVTIKEGLTLEQTAAVVSQVFSFDSTSFADYCMNPDNAKALGVSLGTLEGYLFPNTYRFRPSATVEEVVARMVATFDEVYQSLSPDASTTGLSKEQTLTMASIVEKEAVLDSERTRISGVFYNRYRKHISLGADPTVRYAIRKFTGPLRVSELKNPSPYNTRLHVGLPPGPICSPGKKSLRAALYPMETKDLYFVAKWDGSGAHDFSKTNAEHVRKKNHIRAMNEQRKNGH